MLASTQPSSSTFGRDPPIGVARQSKRPISGDDGSISNTKKQPLWIPMLQSASKGKDLSEKQLIVLGGTSEIQRDFLGHLNPESSSRQGQRSHNRRNQRHNVPISNKFALGYTYHDVLDADQEDILARLNVYMLANPSAQLSVLLRPLLTAKTVKDTLITILLDWSDPFKWARQLRQWIRLLRKVILTLEEETKVAMEENMNDWKERRVGPDAQTSAQQEIVAPPGSGEWDEGLGIPISIVCVQGEKIERLERELGWGDDQFDFLQQWLRTILLKHGGSLIYTASFEPNSVKTLVHTSLGIQSLLKREVAKHNVIDRDKILVPPNWDSWGKIRILREGFDLEHISNAWSVEIQDAPEDTLDLSTSASQTAKPESDIDPQTSLTMANDSSPSSAVVVFEQALPDPLKTSTSQTYNEPNTTTEITVTVTPFQEFLQSQTAILEKFKVEDAANLERIRDYKRGIQTLDPNEPANGTTTTTSTATGGTNSRSLSPVKSTATGLPSSVFDTIGPHRVNVNGIDLDAEEATRRLRERENERTTNFLRRTASETVAKSPTSAASGTVSPVRPGPMSRAESGFSSSAAGAGVGGRDDGGKPSNEALHGFFANLIKKGEQGRNRGSNVASGAASPRRESPAPSGQRREE